MPIYQYRCQKCLKMIEVIQKISDAPLKDCEQCHSQNTLEKCITASRFRLSGGGYYETDEKPKEKQRYIANNNAEV